MLKLKYKILITFFACVSTLALPSVVHAAIPVDCPDGYQTQVATADRAETACADHQTGSATADSVEAEQALAAERDPSRGANLEANCKPAEGEAINKDNCGIVGYIVLFTNVLSAVVGVVIVIMIAVGGVQYSTAGDDPQAVSAAKNRIRNAILALVFYLFTFAFLQYLVPGGIF